MATRATAQTVPDALYRACRVCDRRVVYNCLSVTVPIRHVRSSSIKQSQESSKRFNDFPHLYPVRLEFRPTAGLADDGRLR